MIISRPLLLGCQIVRRVAQLLLILPSVVGSAQAVAAQTLPSDSVYHADVRLTDQNGRPTAFGQHRGQPVLVSMFYTSCPYACPVTIETLRDTLRSLPPDVARTIAVLVISFDSHHDTTSQLKAAARAHGVDDPQWTLVRGEADDVRTIAALLGIRYRELPEGGFNHETVLLLLDRDGRVVARTNRLGLTDPDFVSAIRAVAATP